MPKRKRNSLGKVKHYRQRSYTRKNLLRRRILKWALGLAALFLVGWLVAGPVVNFGSGLWYSLKNRPATSDSSAPQAGSDPAASGSTSEATPEPEEPEATPADTTSIVEGSWTYVSLSALTSEDQAAATAADLASQGVSYAVIALKDAQGYVYYDSQVALAAQSKAGMLVDAAMAARVFKEAGIVPVAALSAFEDPKTPYTDRNLSVHYGSQDVIWLNAAGDIQAFLQRHQHRLLAGTLIPFDDQRLHTQQRQVHAHGQGLFHLEPAPHQHIHPGIQHGGLARRRGPQGLVKKHVQPPVCPAAHGASG